MGVCGLREKLLSPGCLSRGAFGLSALFLATSDAHTLVGFAVAFSSFLLPGESSA
jgi:hypothetical protein